MSFDNIPEELRALNQWVVWRTELREGSDKTTKVPYQARKRGFHPASTTNPDTWTSYTAAHRRVTEYRDMDGIGFVFTPDDPYIGIDLDDMDPGEPRDIDSLPDRTGTYAEYSPSGTGIHLIGRGTTPDGTGKHPKGLGIFQQHRFFTMTGNILDGELRPIRNIQAVIDANWDTWFPEKEESTPLPPVADRLFAADEDIIRKLREAINGDKFERLFGGDTGDFGGDNSAADLALCSLVAFYTQDRDQIARIISASTLGQRDKWRKRADYREMTISKGLERSEFYTPPTNVASGLTIIRSKGEDGTEKQVFTFNTTDAGNALRVLHHYGDAIRYCHALKTWLVWNGKLWEPDESGEISRVSMSALRTIYDEAEAVPSDELKKILKKWAVASEAGARILMVPKLAQDFRELDVSLGQLDAHPYLLNVRNGTVDLSNGSFRPHRREDYLTRIAPVTYDPGATCPVFMKFLDTVFAGNGDLIRFVQKALGYALTGDVTERAMFILYGSGRNGKSTLVETIGRLLGDYATTSSADLVSARKGDPAMPTDLARLVGVRFTAASETGEYSRLDEARVKYITGGDRIVGERKYRDPFEFDPQFKIWLSTNHRPNIYGVDDGIWDRIHLIPFEVRIPDDSVDRYLKDKLLKEAPGILNWMIRGCVAWQAEGIGKDSAVSLATAEYRIAMDSLGMFIQEHCTTGGSVSVGELYSVYEQWAKDGGEPPIPKRRLTNRIKDRGFTVKREGARNVHTIHGLRLLLNSELGNSPNGLHDNVITWKRGA